MQDIHAKEVVAMLAETNNRLEGLVTKAQSIESRLLGNMLPPQPETSKPSEPVDGLLPDLFFGLEKASQSITLVECSLDRVSQYV